MKNSIALKVILLISGLLLIVAGTGTLFFPVQFTGRNGIDLAGQVSLFNDIRGMGGMMLGSGIAIALGAFVRKLAFTSIVISIVIFLSFGLARTISILLDGMPTDTLVKATVLESIIGLVGVFALVKFREQKAG